MGAPFRIRKQVTKQNDMLSGKKSDDIGHWMERLTKLIPGEVLAIYLAGRGYATGWVGSWSAVCIAVVIVVRAWGTREAGGPIQWAAVAIAAVSFAIWVYAMGDQVLGIQLPNPGIAPAAVLVWTTVVPIFYRGD